jgi:prolyl 4-hydroxylase
MTKPLDEKALVWLQAAARGGARPKALTTALVNQGYPRKAVEQAVNSAYGAMMQGMQTKPRTGPAYEYDACPVLRAPRIFAADREVTVRMRLERPQLQVFDSVMSPEECRTLIEFARPRLSRSMVQTKGGGEALQVPTRTSEGTFIRPDEHPLVRQIDLRLASLMNWPVENGEALYVMRYLPGEEFRQHMDYFEVLDESERAWGPRVATLITYLNPVEAGGETEFPAIGLSVTPNPGSAVYFRYGNAKGQLDQLTLHAGKPVIRGEKWVATRWMRARACNAGLSRTY